MKLEKLLTVVSLSHTVSGAFLSVQPQTHTRSHTESGFLRCFQCSGAALSQILSQLTNRMADVGASLYSAQQHNNSIAMTNTNRDTLRLVHNLLVRRRAKTQAWITYPHTTNLTMDTQRSTHHCAKN